MNYLVVINKNQKKSIVPFEFETPIDINFPFFIESVFIDNVKQRSCVPFWSDYQNSVINSETFDTSYLTESNFINSDNTYTLIRSYFFEKYSEKRNTITLVNHKLTNSDMFHRLTLLENGTDIYFQLLTPIHTGNIYDIYSYEIPDNIYPVHDTLLTNKKVLKIADFYVYIINPDSFLNNKFRLYFDLKHNRFSLTSDLLDVSEFTTNVDLPYEFNYNDVFKISLRPFINLP